MMTYSEKKAIQKAEYAPKAVLNQPKWNVSIKKQMSQRKVLG